VSYCLLVPHYNHSAELARFLPALSALGLPILLVDDGSDADHLAQVRRLAAESSLVTLTLHGQNRGKGAAVQTGLVIARAQGFSHALQVDADGQHDLNDVAKFIAASEVAPGHIICGKPTFAEDAPKARVYGRKVTDFWVALETVSLQIKDGLCGFRIYPLTEVERVVDNHFIGSRMDFDTEILVKSVWENIPLQFIETRVIYPEGATSHFHYLRDNLVLIKLHTRLMLGMLIRLPWLLIHRIKQAKS